MRAGRYWMRLSRFFMIAASWSTSRTARLPRLAFMAAQAPSAGFSLGRVSGQPYLGQPARMSAWMKARITALTRGRSAGPRSR